MADERGGDEEGVVERSMSMRMRKDGRIETSSTGRPPTGRERKRRNERQVSNLAWIILQGWGEVWDRLEPEQDENSPVDYWCCAPGRKQAIQVTLVPHNSAIWEKFARQGYYTQTFDAVRHANELIQVIRNKQERYASPDVRKDLLLVLDGSWFLSYDLAGTMREYVARHLEEARGSGFGDIFLLTSWYLHNLLNPDTEERDLAA